MATAFHEMTTRRLLGATSRLTSVGCAHAAGSRLCRPIPWVRFLAPRIPPKEKPKVPALLPRSGEEVRSLDELMLICDKGTQLGVLAPGEALQIATERSLQLLEVAKDAKPPVWRLVKKLDFLEPESEQKKKKEKKKKEAKEKELRFTDRTEDHDLAHRVRLAHGFLSKGISVKVAVLNTGRVEGDITRAEHLVQQFAEACREVGKAGPISGAKDARIDENTDPNNPLLGVVFSIIAPRK